MTQQKHSIKRFSLELQTKSSRQSHALQWKCVNLVKEELINNIDELLSHYFPGDEIVRINKIEIDLGDLTTESLEKDFVAKCMAELTHKIKAIPSKQKQEDEAEITNMTKEENSLQQFFFFLSTGKMPWATYHINFMQWQTELEDVLQTRPYWFKKTFSGFLLKNPQTIERLVMQFDDGFISRLIELFYPGLQKEYDHLITILKEKTEADQNDIIKRTVCIKLLPVLFVAAKKMDEKDIQDIIEWIGIRNSKGADEKILSDIKDAIIAMVKKLDGNIDTTVLAEMTAKNTASENILKSIKKGTEGGKVENTSIYINNAGIIILHPFLQNLFKATGLMILETFKDNFSQQKAVHLLQYLTNGQQEEPEYMMPLNKILCGLSDEERVDRFIKLKEAEIKEADELLQAVITHWAALKNTSIEGLKETFLQRNGKLSFNEADGFWKLQVERKAVDLLLDKIPWGFSYVQLPWMKYALVTVW